MRIIRRCLDTKGLLVVLLQLLLTDSRIQSTPNWYVLHQPEEDQLKKFVYLKSDRSILWLIQAMQIK